MPVSKLSSSFRDPSGFLFSFENQIYRQVNNSYQDNYDKLYESGLYQSLTDKNWLVPHQEVSAPGNDSPDETCYKILFPEQIPYISYPYEWCFSQLKDAALLTLNIQQEALKHGMSLKDATAYNVQFLKARPIFIDTLSFETYREGAPWIAYRQFCQHFLAPLALIALRDIRLIRLLSSYIDGIPLDLASGLLPRRSWVRYSLLAHIHLHARTQKQFEDSGRESAASNSGVSVSKARMEGLVASLKSAVQQLKWKHTDTEWGDYYSDTNYIDQSMQHKEDLVRKMLAKCEKGANPLAADFGANTGKFSRLAMQAGYYVLSQDIDEVAVEKNYKKVRASQEQSLLPLFLDLTNPSPGLGWASIERPAFVERQRNDVGMALALVHHIAISNNVPMEAIARLFAKVCNYLIIEFVPKRDSQVKRLLATREDIFPEYHEDGFEAAFSLHFNILDKSLIGDSERTLYLMQANRN